MPNRAALPEGRCRLVALTLAVLFAAAPATARADRSDDLRRELESLREERAEIELALERARRRIPSEPETGHLETRVRHAAEVAGLAVDFRALDAGAVPSLPDGSPGPLRLDGVELSGRGELFRIGALLSLLAVDDLRLRDLESLIVETDGDAHRFVTRFAYPIWAGAPASASARTLDAHVAELRVEVARLRARRTILETWSSRTGAGRLAAATSLLDALDDLAATAVTRLRLDDRIEVSGATLGAPAREALDRSLADFGFTVAAGTPSGAGACRPFALALGVEGERAAHFARPAGAPAEDERAAALCAFDPGPRIGRLAARGDAARPGAFTLRAHGLDLVDLFRLLHESTGAGFVVDPEVAGRVDADFEGVTLDEALGALAPLGLHLGPGPIRRVSRRPARPSDDDWTGEPTSLTFKRLDLSALLCLFDRAFALPSRVEPGLGAEVSIFVRDQPWDLALVRSIESAGLDLALVDGVAYAAPPERLARVAEIAWLSSCDATPAAASPIASHPQRLADLDPDDLTLVAITDDAAGRRAWAYAAFGRIHALEPGAELHDATVESLDPDAVRVRGADGGIRRLVFAP